MNETSLDDDIARAERDVIDAAVALIMDDQIDDWGYTWAENLGDLREAVKHLEALRKLANTTQGDEQ
jgi:hypothetical protein